MSATNEQPGERLGHLNKHGLARHLPAEVARAVRKRCGFGCVRCGSALYTYEHVDPLFVDAKEHDPDNIVLLCWGCHGLVNKRLLSKESVITAAKNPKALTRGYSHGPFDFGDTHPEVVLGTFRAIRTKTILRVFGEPILRVDDPEEPETPFRLSAYLSGADGVPVLWIENNEWRTASDVWDVESIGPRIIIRNRPGEIHVVLRAEPPRALVVERLRMLHRGVLLECEEGDSLVVTQPNGITLVAAGATATECTVGIDVSSKGIEVGCGCASLSIEMMMGSFANGQKKEYRQALAEARLRRERPDEIHSWKDYRGEVFDKVVGHPSLDMSEVASIYFHPYGLAADVKYGFGDSEGSFTVDLPRVELPCSNIQAVAAADVIAREILTRIEPRKNAE